MNLEAVKMLAMQKPFFKIWPWRNVNFSMGGYVIFILSSAKQPGSGATWLHYPQQPKIKLE